MFNRTNLTLSARTLSNRLNLGTRSLALNAGVNHGDQTLRTRQSYHGVMREGMVWYDVFPIMPERYGILIDPRSFSPQQQCPPSCPIVQPGSSVVTVRVEPDPRPADLIDRPERRVEVGNPRFPSVAVSRAGRRSAERELGFEARFGGKSAGKLGWKRAARRVAKHAAVASAANVGK
jgi:hypothetical protein